MLNLGLQFQPQNIVLDFERAMHAAVNSCWKNVNIFGCKFHLHQNWFRKIQSLNLQQEYKNTNSIIGKYPKYYFGLCFLKPTDVTSFFETELHYLIPQDGRVNKFRAYVLENYIKTDAAFPPKMWAVYSHELI